MGEKVNTEFDPGEGKLLKNSRTPDQQQKNRTTLDYSPYGGDGMSYELAHA